MKKEVVMKLVDILREHGTITVEHLAKHLDITKRRIYSVLPTLEALNMIDRSNRGEISWLEPVKIVREINKYDGNRIIVHCKGVISSIERLGILSLIIEQTAEGFEIEPVKET